MLSGPRQTSQLFDVDALLAQKLAELIQVKQDLRQDTFDEKFMLACVQPDDGFIASLQSDLQRKMGLLCTPISTKSQEVQTVEEKRPAQIVVSVPHVQAPKPTSKSSSQQSPEEYPAANPQPPKQRKPRDQKEMVFATAAQIDNPPPKSGKNQIEELAKAFQQDAEKLRTEQEKQQKEQQEKQQKEEGDGEEKGSKMVQQLISDGVLSTPQDTLQSIHGMSATKNLLSDTVLMPLQFPDLFRNRQISNRVLLHSLPGCGKSFVARCIAGEVQRPLISVSPGQLFSKYQGTSERMVRALFQLANQKKPCVLFLDELDALCGKRGEGESESSRRVKNQLLVELDALSQDVLLLGATNLPWEIDAAVRRRFERRVFVSLPDEEARVSMVRSWLHTCFQSPEEVFKNIAAHTDGYSGADLKVLCKAIDFVPVEKLKEAKWWVKGEDGWRITQQGAAGAEEKNMRDLAGQKIQEPPLGWLDVEPVVARIKASVRQQDIEEHVKFQNQFGSD